MLVILKKIIGTNNQRPCYRNHPKFVNIITSGGFIYISFAYKNGHFVPSNWQIKWRWAIRKAGLFFLVKRGNGKLIRQFLRNFF
jgi:hypothetical protein